MKTRYFALIYGIVFLLVGIAGFIPGLVTPLEADPSLAITASSSHLFGLFPVNLLHNLVHVASASAAWWATGISRAPASIPEWWRSHMPY
jgi:Domain of unknown function (DUF4383)